MAERLTWFAGGEQPRPRRRGDRARTPTSRRESDLCPRWADGR